MQANPPLQLPGYTWDPQTKRFFKTPTSVAKHTPASSARTASSRQQHAQAKDESAARKRKRARKTLDKGKWRAVEPAGLGALRNLELGRWDSVGRTERMHHDLRASSMSRLSSVRTIYPDCVPVDDSILHLSFDELNPTTLRIGTSSGTIATGHLARPQDELAYYPNDEEGWRTSWFCPSKITSLRTCGERIVATSLGPPAQAIVGTTRDNISLASVTLSPRKTSLWTSAISPTLLALGCDKKVLLWTDPSRAGQMDAYTTGGNRGDGTVFALDLHEELVFAGTRKGRVHVFDRRASRGTSEHGGGGGGKRRERETRAEMQLNLASPVTHVRHLKERPHQVVVAGMDGFLGLYDLRFPSSSSTRPAPASRATTSGTAKPTPVVELKGHVNSFATDLGFDVWRDEWVAAALSFAALDPLRLRSQGYVERLTPDSAAGEGRWGAPSLWVADGAGLEGFAVV
ncbi:DDB1- and CUL4-associated factor 4 [Rhodotorula kratochvilovae]